MPRATNARTAVTQCGSPTQPNRDQLPRSWAAARWVVVVVVVVVVVCVCVCVRKAPAISNFIYLPRAF